MILLIDSSGPICKLSFIDIDNRRDDSYEAGRELAHGLLKRIDDNLSALSKTWSDITGIGAFQGPGSFTGLRIGLTVVNTIADGNKIPIVGAQGDDWQSVVLDRLQTNQDDRIVLPFYGAEANITKPKK